MVLIASPPSRRVDVKAELSHIDLASVATRMLGPAARSQGNRLYWHCPFHEDRNPSFYVEIRERRWHCWPCGIHGDAVELVKRLKGVGFREAADELTGRVRAKASRPISTQTTSSRRPTNSTASQRKPDADTPALPEGEVRAAVLDSIKRLDGVEGAEAIEYLTKKRLLDRDAIHAARLGVSSAFPAISKDGRRFTVEGIVMPWFDGDRVVRVKVHAFTGKPVKKYVQAWEDREIPATLYPSPQAVRAGKPVVIAEGEFDTLVLAQCLGDSASVVTAGSASEKPSSEILNRLLSAPVWLVALDADDAGDRHAPDWTKFGRAVRIRPPSPFNDWTDAARGQSPGRGVNLARWWRDVLAGNASPPLFTWDDLSAWRWGPGLDDPSPGITPEGGRFDPEAFALATTPGVDPEADAEREAIRSPEHH